MNLNKNQYLRAATLSSLPLLGPFAAPRPPPPLAPWTEDSGHCIALIADRDPPGFGGPIHNSISISSSNWKFGQRFPSTKAFFFFKKNRKLRTLSVTYPLCGSALTDTPDNPFAVFAIQ